MSSDVYIDLKPREGRGQHENYNTIIQEHFITLLKLLKSVLKGNIYLKLFNFILQLQIVCLYLESLETVTKKRDTDQYQEFATTSDTQNGDLLTKNSIEFSPLLMR